MLKSFTAVAGCLLLTLKRLAAVADYLLLKLKSLLPFAERSATEADELAAVAGLSAR